MRNQNQEMINGKILVVEDDPWNRYLLERKLLKKGYEVVTAKDEKEFWKEAFDQSLSLIILDICLKKRLGTDVYRCLLDFGLDHTLPVIFITGLVEEKCDWEGILEYGEEHYAFFPKPIDFDNIHIEIQRLLKEGSLERTF